MAKEKFIFPLDDDQMLIRPLKEKFLNQKSKVLWFTGLSGAGKSTIALALERELFQRGFLTQVLDGDNIRAGINNNLTFSKEDRLENIRRVAEVSKLFMDCGIICINSFITPREEMRNLARDVIGEKDYIEIFINASLEACERRDIKGLYKRARAGEIKNFTGIDAPFELPANADIVVDTDHLSVEESVKYILDKLLPEISF